MVDPLFAPAVGHTRRQDFQRDLTTLRFSPRLRNNRYMRKLLAGDVRLRHRRRRDHRRESVDRRQLRHQVPQWRPHPVGYVDGAVAATELPDRAGRHGAEGLQEPHRIGVLFAGQSAQDLGRLAAAAGAFYEGTRQEYSYSGRISFVPQFAVEPVRRSRGSTVRLATCARLIVAIYLHADDEVLRQQSAAVERRRAHLAASVRLRWTVRSDLFVVYSDGRDTARPGTLS
jgi:hypothetical protein